MRQKSKMSSEADSTVDAGTATEAKPEENGADTEQKEDSAVDAEQIKDANEEGKPAPCADDAVVSSTEQDQNDVTGADQNQPAQEECNAEKSEGDVKGAEQQEKASPLQEKIIRQVEVGWLCIT